MKESILTFSDPDGSAKKGDTLVTSIDQALQKLKEMIGNKRSDTKNEKKNSKWYFKACPYKQFDKTLDETFMCFIKWAKVKKKNGGDERYDEYNVSKVSKGRFWLFLSTENTCIDVQFYIIVVVIFMTQNT